jgi:hypothetical protein
MWLLKQRKQSNRGTLKKKLKSMGERSTRESQKIKKLKKDNRKRKESRKRVVRNRLVA